MPLPTVPATGRATRIRGEEFIADIAERGERIKEDFYEIGVNLGSPTPARRFACWVGSRFEP